MMTSIKKSLITVTILAVLLFISLLSFAKEVSKPAYYQQNQGTILPLNLGLGETAVVYRYLDGFNNYKVFETKVSLEKRVLVDKNPRKGINNYEVNYYSNSGELIKSAKYRVYVPVSKNVKVHYDITKKTGNVLIESIEPKPYPEYVLLEIVGEDLQIIDHKIARLLNHKPLAIELENIKRINSIRIYKNNYQVSSKSL